MLLGAAFLGIGYALSAIARRPGAAAGLAVGLWLVLIVLYDLGLLAAVVADDGGRFTAEVFPWLLVANPADAFRLYNLAASEATAAASGIGGAANSRRVGGASRRAHRSARETRALSVEIPVFAYICR